MAVTCGRCTKFMRDTYGGYDQQVKHASAADVRQCYGQERSDAEERWLEDMEYQVMGEQEAERIARNYDECGRLNWDDEALDDLARHPFDPQINLPGYGPVTDLEADLLLNSGPND